MNRYSDLPPGCSPSDIPGNRPEDGVEEELLEMFAKAWSYGFDEKQILALWAETVTAEEEKAEAYEREREDA